MKKTADKRIVKLAEKLEEAKINPKISEQIMEGCADIGAKAGPEEKAAWFRGAMEKMDKLIEKEMRYAIRESCACCLTGRKLKSCEKIASDYATVEERIKAVNDKKFICGSLKMTGKNEITAVGDDERYKNQCVCLPNAGEPISITYCQCCGGHAKHHLQVALGRKLEGGVIASPLSSRNKYPCTFRFKMVD